MSVVVIHVIYKSSETTVNCRRDNYETGLKSTNNIV